MSDFHATVDAMVEAKARIKRAIKAQLAELPTLHARAEMIAEIRVELAEEAGREGKTTSGTRPGRPPQPAARTKAPARRAPRQRPAKQQAASESANTADDDAGPTARTYALLKAHPRMPLAEMMKIVYPDDKTGETHKIRSVLFSLKKQKKALNVGHGQWEVIA